MGFKKMMFRVGMKLKKHSPELLLAAGLVAGGAAIVTACVQTTKAGDILERHSQMVDDAHRAREVVIEDGTPEEYTEWDERMNVVAAYRRTGWEMIKLYALPAALCALSTAAILASYGIMRRRNLALTAAYTSLYGAFKAYRTRVREEAGEDADFHYLTGSEKVEIETLPPEGKGKPKKEIAETIPVGTSPYALIFDKRCPGFENDETLDMHTLTCLQRSLNFKLETSPLGAVWWNDLIKEGRFPANDRTINPLTRVEGQMVGWIKGDPGSGYIDLRPRQITRFDEYGRKETYYVLDPNVDGVINDLIEMKEAEHREALVNKFRRSNG